MLDGCSEGSCVSGFLVGEVEVCWVVAGGVGGDVGGGVGGGVG